MPVPSDLLDAAAPLPPTEVERLGATQPVPATRPARLAMRPLYWSLSACLVGCAVMLVARMVMAINEAVLEANPTLDPRDPAVWWIRPDAYEAWMAWLQLPLLLLTALGVIGWSWRLHGLCAGAGHAPGFPRHRLCWMWWVPGLQFAWPVAAFARLRGCAWAVAGRRVGSFWVVAWWTAAVLGLLSSIAAAAWTPAPPLAVWGQLVPGGLLLVAALLLLLIVEDVQRALRRWAGASAAAPSTPRLQEGVVGQTSP